MSLENIQQDQELVKKLTSIHKVLTSLMKEDVDNDKFKYEERDLSHGINPEALNEHIAHTRLKKINTLKLLSDNWDSFKEYYKEDSILNKIGEEFIRDKFKCDEKIIREIKQYPFKKQVLYYFQKGVDVKMEEISPDFYAQVKSQILPEIEKNAIAHIQRKDILLKSLAEIKEDKSQINLEKMWVLHGNSPLGTVDLETGTFIGKVMDHVKSGDFKYELYGTQMTIQVPIAGTIEINGVKEKINSSILAVDLKNPSEYSMQVGTLEKPKMILPDRIKGIRENAFKKSHEPGFKIV